MKPINMKPWEVQALLENRKSSARRVVKPQPVSKLAYVCMGYKHGTWGYPGANAWEYWEDESFRLTDGLTDMEKDRRWTPPCHTGDILYVRETFCKEDDKFFYRADFESDYLDPCETLSGGYPASCRYRNCDTCCAPMQRIIWSPSIHMPRKAARIFLRVTDVRVERLQKSFLRHESTILNLQKEGVGIGEQCRECIETYGSPCCIDTESECGVLDDVRSDFANLWDSTLKPKDRALYGWEANPWVWVIEFERISKEAAPCPPTT